MNGYYGFVPSHLQLQTLLSPPINGLGHLPSQNPRKREHPDANRGPEDCRVDVNGFACGNAQGLELGVVRVEQLEYERAKRVCLESREVYLGTPHPQSPVPSACPGPMDCSSYPRPVDRGVSGHPNGVRLPYRPSDPQEADIIDMNPVAPGPVAATHTNIVKMHARRAQLCLMEELCSCTQTMGISVLECPKCLAGEAGHLMHILDSQGMETH